LKEFFRKTRWMFLVAIVIDTLDQFTKHLVRTNLAVGQTWTPWPWLTPYARVIHWSNTGVAFGMFQGKNLIFVILAALVAAAIIYYYPSIPEKDKVVRFALAMMLGGAIGNLIDRILIGQVTDFISVGNFAVFNVADGCITVGVGILLIGVWLQEKHEKEQKKEAALTVPVSDSPDDTNS
jgi:signal peptidase II